MSNPYQSSRPDESHMPKRDAPKPTEASEYLCGGKLRRLLVNSCSLSSRIYSFDPSERSRAHVARSLAACMNG